MRLHCGCIGGHGRTGTFLAALVTEMSGEKDSISYVRDNYCHRAVESTCQIDFLAEHFGITKVAHAKKGFDVKAVSKGSTKGVTVYKGGGTATGTYSGGSDHYAPVESKTCIW